MSGTQPYALSVISHWLGEESSPASVFAVVAAETQTE